MYSKISVKCIKTIWKPIIWDLEKCPL